MSWEGDDFFKKAAASSFWLETSWNLDPDVEAGLLIFIPLSQLFLIGREGSFKP